MKKRPPTYPAFLLLDGAPALVVGGGEVAARKVEALRAAGAVVTVVAIEAVQELLALAGQGALTLHLRPYQAGEALNYFVTVAATSDPGVNRGIADEVRGAGKLINVVDVPELCNFIVPSIIQRGDLTVAVSTGGASPAMARWLRLRIEKALPERVGALLEMLGELRERVRAKYPDEETRKRILTDVMNSEIVEKFVEGDDGPLKEYLEQWT